MELFIDKYKPDRLNKVSFNNEIANELLMCTKLENIPHMVIRGPSGSGKSTFANLFIKEKYGSLNLKTQLLEIKCPSKTLELHFIHSNYHYQIDPITFGVYDKIIIQRFIKDILQTKPISKSSYHTVIIDNSEYLTLEAQQSLRRILEKTIDNCRFIFILNQNNTLIEPLMSRCLQFRLSAPTSDKCLEILHSIVKLEDLKTNGFTNDNIYDIVSHSERNLKSAINTLQYVLEHDMLWQNKLNFTEIYDYEKYIIEIQSMFFSGGAPTKIILDIREKLYGLLTHCIEPIVILKKIFKSLIAKTPSKYHHKLIECLVKYETTMKQGSKPIYHLEGFVTQCLCVFT
jgi:replication factor C subunit 3/5